MKIYKGKSKLHGIGIFASRNIKKGEVVLIVKGEKIKFLIDNNSQAEIAELNWFGFSKNIWVGVSNNFCDFLNHSCNPNVGIKGRVTLIAIKNIKKDEEITLDYSLNEADIFWKMNCNCGNINCRKTIKSIQFLPEDTYNKYLPFIPLYFQSVFRNFKVSNFSSRNKFIEKWVLFLKSNK